MGKRFVMCMKCGSVLIDMKRSPYCNKCQKEIDQHRKEQDERRAKADGDNTSAKSDKE